MSDEQEGEIIELRQLVKEAIEADPSKHQLGWEWHERAQWALMGD